MSEAAAEGVSAVDAPNDDTAAPCSRPPRPLDRAVPGRLAVVGVDDTPMAPQCLTSRMTRWPRRPVIVG
ncbi:hypothetical protein [Nonomuraea rubra]|uniref:hypothetical protein n=1 Tax=Nonomuraea rubra TaxID=46180 RepID=UPI0033E14D87